MAALAVAYQVQCRLSDAAPVRDKGFDHTTQGCYALAAGIAKALGLDPLRTAHAIAISGTAFNALRVTRTGALSHWKGLAYPNAAFCCTHAAFLAMRGITGPLEVFEGRKGFMEAIAGRFDIAWPSEDLERVTQTILKEFNAEVHSQSAIEGILELRSEHSLGREEDVERIEIETFDVAYNIIGGGNEGEKTLVRTKEEADHSLPYMVAVALLDGQVMPEQYLPERIGRGGRSAAARQSRRAPGGGIQPPVPRRDAVPGDRCAARRPEARAGEARLRGLPHAADELGRRGGEVRAAERALLGCAAPPRYRGCRRAAGRNPGRRPDGLLTDVSNGGATMQHRFATRCRAGSPLRCATAEARRKSATTKAFTRGR